MHQSRMKQIELLDTGEVKLSSGKIIGHRQWKHEYSQYFRNTLTKEQILIQKLKLSYKKSKELEKLQKNQINLNPAESRQAKSISQAEKTKQLKSSV